MRCSRLALFMAVACMIVLAAGQAAFGAPRTVKFQVDGCD
jgi:hypothetical protein